MDSERNPNIEAYQRAITFAASERRDVQARISVLEAELSELKSREGALNALVHAMHQLLPEGDAKEWTAIPDDDAGVDGAEAEEPDVRPTWLSIAAEPIPLGGPLPQPAFLSRNVAVTSSPYRVGLILRDADRPMTRTEIIAEYESQGWIEADWKDADANISQAIRRAIKYGWASQVPNMKWTFVTTQNSSVQPDAVEVQTREWAPS